MNVLFKNFEINSAGDKVLVYLLVLISHLFKVTENLYIKFYLENKLVKLKKDCLKSQVLKFLYQNKNQILLL